ncbi:hypothetical protein BJV74DRAFT_836942 [Russula compacta]|nr:hypothetical protein BJV74DRAFT_836942 [Russula compacta]
MLVSSKVFPNKAKTSSVHTLVLRYGPRRVLVLLPNTYQELLKITRAVFGAALDSTVVFETSDLDICQGVAVEIHPSAWEAIALTVSTVVVKNDDSASPGGGEDGGVSQHSHIRDKPSLTPKRAAHIVASRSSNEATQPEDGLSGPATSYDDVQDILSAGALAEEDLGSYEDDFDIAPAPRKGKDKGKSRARIESDDEPEDGDEDGYAAAVPVAKLPTSYRMRNAVEPSFSIVPSSPKRVATPPKTNRGLGGPGHSDEEQGDVKPPAYNAYKHLQVAADVSSRRTRTTPNSGTPKEAQDDGTDPAAQSKPKPQLKLEVAPSLAPAPAPPTDKLLITIRHPPTEKENKFKVKATHTVGRVLASACVAFGLNATSAVLMLWTEEDGIEIPYPCENHLSMGSVAADGTIFIIELSKEVSMPPVPTA